MIFFVSEKIARLPERYSMQARIFVFIVKVLRKRTHRLWQERKSRKIDEKAVIRNGWKFFWHFYPLQPFEELTWYSYSSIPLLLRPLVNGQSEIIKVGRVCQIWSSPSITLWQTDSSLWHTYVHFGRCYYFVIYYSIASGRQAKKYLMF